MLYFGCSFCKHFRQSPLPYCAAFPERVPIQYLGGTFFHLARHPKQIGDTIYEYSNQDRFPDAVLWGSDDWIWIGSLGEDDALVQVGFEDASKAEALVVRCDLRRGEHYDVHLIALSGLMSHAAMDLRLFGPERLPEIKAQAPANP
jgi:hypothetical protein